MDPRSKIPEFKVSACVIEKAAKAPDWARPRTEPGADGRRHLLTRNAG
jgi:hypothetical protein